MNDYLTAFLGLEQSFRDLIIVLNCLKDTMVTCDAEVMWNEKSIIKDYSKKTVKE